MKEASNNEYRSQRSKEEVLKKEVVKGATFTIEPESIIGLLGRNGAGKSTVPFQYDCSPYRKDKRDITL